MQLSEYDPCSARARCGFLYNIGVGLLLLEWLKGGILLRKRARMTLYLEEMLNSVIDGIGGQEATLMGEANQPSNTAKRRANK